MSSSRQVVFGVFSEVVVVVTVEVDGEFLSTGLVVFGTPSSSGRVSRSMLAAQSTLVGPVIDGPMSGSSACVAFGSLASLQIFSSKGTVSSTGGSLNSSSTERRRVGLGESRGRKTCWGRGSGGGLVTTAIVCPDEVLDFLNVLEEGCIDLLLGGVEE